MTSSKGAGRSVEHSFAANAVETTDDLVIGELRVMRVQGLRKFSEHFRSLKIIAALYDFLVEATAERGGLDAHHERGHLFATNFEAPAKTPRSVAGEGPKRTADVGLRGAFWNPCPGGKGGGPTSCSSLLLSDGQLGFQPQPLEEGGGKDPTRRHSPWAILGALATLGGLEEATAPGVLDGPVGSPAAKAQPREMKAHGYGGEPAIGLGLADLARENVHSVGEAFQETAEGFATLATGAAEFGKQMRPPIDVIDPHDEKEDERVHLR